MEKSESATSAPQGRRVEANFAIGAGWGGKIHKPIHETLTFAALGHCNYGIPQGTSLSAGDNSQWEFVRGVIFNDDPDSLLFDDKPGENHTHSSAATWAAKYVLGQYQWESDSGDKLTNATGRSHFGDLQFLHCMASVPGESPTETKRKIMTWIEVLWKLTAGEDGITAETIISNSAIGQFFPEGSAPYRGRSFKSLLGGDTKFDSLDIQRRALGSILHFIQDSYALGHTRRVLLNPQDALENVPLRFKQGFVDRWGAIENFHNYNGQDEDLHEFYDHSSHPIPDPDNLGNLDQFDYLLGTRDAVDKCIEFIQLKQAGKTWSTGIQDFFDKKVFVLAANATPANTEVWP